MPISHVFAEGIGPFANVHLDLRGKDGRASYGPHILAGVNGTGKSSLLHAIAWAFSRPKSGFPIREWIPFLEGHSHSRIFVVMESAGREWLRAITTDQQPGWEQRVREWIGMRLSEAGKSLDAFDRETYYDASIEEFNEIGYATIHNFSAAILGDSPSKKIGGRHFIAAYSPAKRLAHLNELNLSAKTDALKDNLSFDTTVNNAAVQAWLVTLYSRRAIAKERHQQTEKYTATFRALEEGLQRVCGNDVSIVIDIEPRLQPRLKIGSSTFTFSQIPDGVKSTLGWLADYMMRADSMDWDPTVADRRPGILLFDEIESFLHPLWQRRILPAMSAALPNTQFIVTSHSPFVISSHRDAMIHMLKLDRYGHAYAEPSVRAPIGESITSTLKDIFGVDSRFDVETEEELAEWNQLSKTRTSGKLSPKEETRFRDLSRTLASRSEELRSLVNPVTKLDKATVDRLTAQASKNRAKRLAAR